MKHSSRWLIGGVLTGLVFAMAFWWWQQTSPKPSPTAAAPVTGALPTLPIMAVPQVLTEPAPTASGPMHPMENLDAVAPSPAEPLPGLGESDRRVKQALIAWLGQRSVLTFFQLDGLIRRVVATVDNLARPHAASRLWPVAPTPDRFLVLQRGEDTYLAEGNAERYRPFVRFVTTIDEAKAAALYRQWYPLFQQAYEDLGYPRQYFNDRMVVVIDQLLLTPELMEPIQLTLTEVKGSVPVQRPWVRYEFVDPALQALPAGQKIILRMGNANAQALKAKLAAFRQHIAARQR